MQLNLKKCQMMIMRNGHPEPPQPITVAGHVLESTKSYKYLGFNANTELDWNQQWEYVTKKINSTPYLLRQLRRHGLRQEVLVSVYRSLALSHISYNAPVLCSTTAGTKREMESFQKRALKAIGISQETALRRYKITTIDQLIRNTNRRIISKILSDPSHVITKKIARTIPRAGRPVGFKPNKAKTEKYQKSVLQVVLRDIRDNPDNPSAIYSYRQQVQPAEATAPEKPMTLCPQCVKFFKNLKLHQTMSKSCNNSVQTIQPEQ